MKARPYRGGSMLLIQPAQIVAPILVAAAHPLDKRRLMRCLIAVTDVKGDTSHDPHPCHSGAMLAVEFAQQKVPLEVTMLLFYRRTLAIHSHGTGAVVFVTGDIQGLLGPTERRQTDGRHSPCASCPNAASSISTTSPG